MQDVMASPLVLYILTLRRAPCEVISPGGPAGAELSWAMSVVMVSSCDRGHSRSLQC